MNPIRRICEAWSTLKDVVMILCSQEFRPFVVIMIVLYLVMPYDDEFWNE
jgi:hypothetical protein